MSNRLRKMSFLTQILGSRSFSKHKVLIDVLASPAQSSAPAQPQADAATSADTQTHDSKISSCNIQRIQTSGERVCVSPLRPTSEGHESNMRNRVPMIKVT